MSFHMWKSIAGCLLLLIGWYMRGTWGCPKVSCEVWGWNARARMKSPHGRCAVLTTGRRCWPSHLMQRGCFRRKPTVLFSLGNIFTVMKQHKLHLACARWSGPTPIKSTLHPANIPHGLLYQGQKHLMDKLTRS